MILSDPIGSGKTVSAILGMRKLLEIGEIQLVIGVTPGSVLHQWATEFRTWFPGVFNIEIADGDIKSRIKQYERIVANQGHPFRHVHVLMLSYSMCRQDKEVLKQLPFQMIFFDEITHLKDNKTEQSQAAQMLADMAERTLGITALPAQSKFEEVFPLFNVVDKSLFGSRTRFMANFCHTWKHVFKTLEGRTIRTEEVRGYKNLEMFKEMVSHHLLYRTEDDIGLQMPEQILIPRWLKLTAAQRTRYNQLEEGFLEIDNYQEPIEGLQQLTRLMQVCNATQLVYPERSSCKVEEIRSLLTTELSSDQVVIFSKWTEMLEIVRQDVLEPLCTPYGKITGEDSSPANRERARLAFQGGETQVILLSTAGEEGLNLGAAKCMICCDSLFNEGRMRQVHGRIRRLSTVHPNVRIINLLVKDTVEERILELRAKRGALIDYMDDPVGMNPADLIEVMALINKQITLLD
jgi:SNF2 family DNA or RNA helicase